MASIKLDIDKESVKSWLEKADIVYVIRCKDCYWHSQCRFEQELGLNGFCSKGEMKEDEERLNAIE